MTVLSSILSLQPDLSAFLNVSGRLSGFFQYSNVFSLFLLLCVVVCIVQMTPTSPKSKRLFTLFQLCILLYGILASGSRTCIVLLGLFCLLSLYLQETRFGGIHLLCFGVLGALVAGGYAIWTNDFSTVGRFLTTSLNASTFVGRILYSLDALPVIATHPLGLGYLGYYYLQGSFQTGMYASMYVHNDLLQFFLDAGWIAGIALLFLLVKAVFAKHQPLLCRLMVGCIGLYSALDFHLQFISIFFILLLALDYGVDVPETPIVASQTDTQSSSKRANKRTHKKKPQKVQNTPPKPVSLWHKQWRISPVLQAICLVGVVLYNGYFAVALGAEYFDKQELALSLYPLNTRIQTAQLAVVASIADKEVLVQDILPRNQSLCTLYNAQALAAYRDGDFAGVIEAKQKELPLAKYDLDRYLEFMDMLSIGKSLYLQNGDTQSADYCQMWLNEVPVMLAEVNAKTSPLTKYMDEQTPLVLPEQYVAMVEQR